MSKKTLTLPDESFNPPPAIMELEQAAEVYAEKRDNRMDWGRQEVIAKGDLLRLMIKHGLKEYTSQDESITINFDVEETIKVKVAKKKPAVAPEPETEGEPV